MSAISHKEQAKRDAARLLAPRELAEQMIALKRYCTALGMDPETNVTAPKGERVQLSAELEEHIRKAQADGSLPCEIAAMDVIHPLETPKPPVPISPEVQATLDSYSHYPPGVLAYKAAALKRYAAELGFDAESVCILQDKFVVFGSNMAEHMRKARSEGTLPPDIAALYTKEGIEELAEKLAAGQK